MRAPLLRALFITLLVVATTGCRTDIQQYVVQRDLAAIDGATVTSLRLADGSAVRFDTTRGVIRAADGRVITGRTVAGDSVDIPFAHVAEADARVATTSTPGTWLLVCVTIVGVFLAVMSQYSSH